MHEISFKEWLGKQELQEWPNLHKLGKRVAAGVVGSTLALGGLGIYNTIDNRNPAASGEKPTISQQIQKVTNIELSGNTPIAFRIDDANITYKEINNLSIDNFWLNRLVNKKLLLDLIPTKITNQEFSSGDQPQGEQTFNNDKVVVILNNRTFEVTPARILADSGIPGIEAFTTPVRVTITGKIAFQGTGAISR